MKILSFGIKYNEKTSITLHPVFLQTESNLSSDTVVAVLSLLRRHFTRCLLYSVHCAVCVIIAYEHISCIAFE